MRIIAGQRRGHKIDGPVSRATRPTSDRVREALFNILRGVIEDVTVVDLFAGTGALGLEALSRGASRAIFVERHRQNLSLIRRNLTTLRYEDRGSIVPGDAYRWAASFEAIDDQPMVVFLDPPYREYETHPKRVRQLLENLVARLPNRSTIVVESGRPLDEHLLPDRGAWDCRRYGGTYAAIRTLNSPSFDSEPNRSHDDHQDKHDR